MESKTRATGNGPEEIFDPKDCPIRQVVAKVSGKWPLLVLHAVRRYEPVRTGDLLRAIPDVSAKMLAVTLRSLEADGLLQRTVYAQVPPRVDYRLTPCGKSLMPLLDALTGWAVENLPGIVRSRRAFSRREKAGERGAEKRGMKTLVVPNS